MIVPAPILHIPLPVIAGVLAGTASQFEILHNLRRLTRKWNLLKRLKMETGMRSKFKKRNFLACIKAFRNECIVKKNVTCSSMPQKPSTENATFFSLKNKDSQLAEDSTITSELREDLKFCNVKTDVKFSNAIPFWKQRYARKIAEGSYGEIYEFRHIDGTKRIFKCIPVDGQHSMNSYPNIPFSIAMTDIVCSKCLSDLNEGTIYAAPNFPIIYNICLVRDRFPEPLMRTWWDFKNNPERLKDPAEHPRPDQYSESQLYLTIESSFCGEPLTMKLLQNAWMGVSIMSQITSALAVAEVAHNFEHRDLHLGNILMQSTSTVSLKYAVLNQNFSIITVGCQIFIIDFTLSRIYNDQNVYCCGLDSIAQQSDDRRDSTESIWLNHKNMYKIMAEYSKGKWEKYMPITNIIWLKYLSENILNYLQMNNPHFAKLVSPQDENYQMTAVRLLKKWNDCMLDHKSATDLLKSCILKDNPLVSVCK